MKDVSGHGPFDDLLMLGILVDFLAAWFVMGTSYDIMRMHVVQRATAQVSPSRLAWNKSSKKPSNFSVQRL